MMPPAPILNIGMITPPPKFEEKVGIDCLDDEILEKGN